MIKIVDLDSGVRLVLEKLDHVKSVATGIWVKTGAVNEVEQHSGISHFVEHMMFNGTETMTGRELAEAVDAIGGQSNAFTSKEMTCYFIKTMDTAMIDGAKILVDMVENSIFLEKEMDKERKVIAEEIKMTLDTPDDLVIENITEAVFSHMNLGKSIIGTPETLEAITRDVMVDYVANHYTRDSIVVSVAGNFDENQVIEFYNGAFKNLKSGQKKRPEVNGIFKPDASTEIMDIKQSHIALGIPGLSSLDERRFALSILMNVMGGSMSSRLFQSIREQQALAYSVYGSTTFYIDGGITTIYAGVAHDKTEQAVNAIIEELRKLKRDGITKEELESSKTQLKSNLVFYNENVSTRMLANGKSLLTRGAALEMDQLVEGYDKVTMEDIDNIKELITDESKYCWRGVSNDTINF